MKLVVQAGNRLVGEAAVPGDKSISHRAALLAALAEGESRVENFLVSGVTHVLLRSLAAMGVDWRMEGDALCVGGVGLGGLRSPQAALDCGSSATTIRLLAGALAAAGIAAVLDGSAGLRRRPMGRIVEPLQAMGTPISAAEGGCAPLTLLARPSGQALLPLEYDLPVASAQVKTCLLLAALAAAGPVSLTEPALSRDHTERMLGSMGVRIVTFSRDSRPGVRIFPLPPGGLAPLHMAIPGDFSAAAFLLVAGLAAPGSQVNVRGVGLNPTRAGLLASLLEMGADIRTSNTTILSGEPVGDLAVRAGELHGVRVSGERVVQMIDEFPVFAVAAAFAHGKTEVVQAEELRYKESDRISTVCAALAAMGVQVEELPDGFVIHGQARIPGGAQIDSQGDHRLAMSMMVAGLRAERPVVVQNAGILAESFPNFPGVLRGLGADVVETE